MVGHVVLPKQNRARSSRRGRPISVWLRTAFWVVVLGGVWIMQLTNVHAFKPKRQLKPHEVDRQTQVPKCEAGDAIACWNVAQTYRGNVFSYPVKEWFHYMDLSCTYAKTWEPCVALAQTYQYRRPRSFSKAAHYYQKACNSGAAFMGGYCRMTVERMLRDCAASTPRSTCESFR